MKETTNEVKIKIELELTTDELSALRMAVTGRTKEAKENFELWKGFSQESKDEESLTHEVDRRQMEYWKKELQATESVLAKVQAIH